MEGGLDSSGAVVFDRLASYSNFGQSVIKRGCSRRGRAVYAHEPDLPCWCKHDQLGAGLTEPNPIIKMATLLWRKCGIVARTARCCSGDVRRNPNIDRLRRVQMRRAYLPAGSYLETQGTSAQEQNTCAKPSR
jgi:hypothetical protein